MPLNATTDAAFTDDVLASPLPVLVEFTAEWCPPCKTIAPVLEQIADSERDRMRVVALDVDANPETTMKYQVMGMPTLALFVSGEVVAQIVGARPRAAIMRELEPHLRRSAPSVG
ncbi:thioredoxin domain-containing protein [Glycomyces sp. A-F 0318]|uniref:thioredoxin family protein n=1 Tax=Glycomyces amatae TaxID=2881355 RepID=UPI001E5B4B87|nr:thioredoxin domain-containing protein [Glycomyces amatae]MCD0443061.1 thioredoxin domain-containing protein [Glycomyces amatae]